jgi:MFS family permease
MALLADLTRDEVRTRAMAAIGIGIGATFAISLVVATPLASAIGVPGIFVATGVLALVAIAVVARGVPDVPRPATPTRARLSRAAIANPQLLRLGFGIFALHDPDGAVRRVPFAARRGPRAGVTGNLPAVLVASILVVLPLFRVADRPGRSKRDDRGDRDSRWR